MGEIGMGHALLPEEILIGMLKIGKFNKFIAPSHFLHRTVYDLRKNAKFTALLKPFRFSGSPAAPFSEVLEHALFNLQYSNKLKRFNPDLVEYQTSEETDIYYDKIVKPKIDSDLQKTISDLALKITSLQSKS
ncbi:hypothetical protein L6279_04125 [Candidatus Parcubacteria bacterium]|nr:hypothetical protein [Patescibacteria group bacterium]MCG2693268.1 hypothetical protein [Candidatus Parcubacteria bacterium]